MKKTISLQDLFDDLPEELLCEHPVTPEEFDDAVCRRVWRRVRADACVRSTRRSPKRLWVFAAVAVLLVAATMSCLALTAHVFLPQYGFTASNTFAMLTEPSAYDGAATLGIVTESNGLRVTLDSFILDSDSETLYLNVTVERVDGASLMELTDERMSSVADMSFRTVTLYRDGTPVVLMRNKPGEGYNRGGAGTISRRDDASDPARAQLLIAYHANGSDRDLAGENLVLGLTDLVDVVRCTEDIGFGYASLEKLTRAVGLGDEQQVQEKLTDSASLDKGKTAVSFSTALDRVTVDGTAAVYDSESETHVLYISYRADTSDTAYMEAVESLGFVDMQNGEWYGGRRCAVQEGRVTMAYHGVSADDLSHLFLMKYIGYETVVRAEGQWTFSFETRESDRIPVYTLSLDETLTHGGYTLHATRLVISDSSVYLEGEVLDAGDQANSDLVWDYHASVTLADGSVLSPIFAGGGALTLFGDGTFRFGEKLNGFTDCTQFRRMTVFGSSFDVEWE